MTRSLPALEGSARQQGRGRLPAQARGNEQSNCGSDAHSVASDAVQMTTPQRSTYCSERHPYLFPLPNFDLQGSVFTIPSGFGVGKVWKLRSGTTSTLFDEPQ